MYRKIMILFAVVLIISTFSFTAFAEDFEPQKNGSIFVTLTEQHNNEPIVGVEFSVYYVAKVNLNSNGNLSYVYTEDFRDAEIDMKDPSFLNKLDAFAASQDIYSLKMITDESGTATCKDIELGLYLIRQTGVEEGFARCKPFMVTVPTKNIDGFTYDVNASPKTEVAKLVSITIKKVWNTDESTDVTENVTMQLLRNGNVIRTAILSDVNDWQVTYDGMPESDEYEVKELDVPEGFTATYSKSGYTYTVTNTATLIQTGQLLWPIPVLAAIGMILIAVGVILLHRKRKINE